MSKGSKQRPTNAQAFGANYDAIFGKVFEVEKQRPIPQRLGDTIVFSRPETYLKAKAFIEDQMTCGNCKHWIAYQTDPHLCTNEKVKALLGSDTHNGGAEYLQPPCDFSCNRWEAKT